MSTGERPPTAHKLEHAIRRQIVARFVEGWTIERVWQYVRDEHGIELNRSTLYKNYHPNSKDTPVKWRKFAARYRRLNEKAALKQPLAQKANRIRVLSEAINECLSWRTKSLSEWGAVEHRQMGALPALIRELRIEVEGEKPLIDASTHNHTQLVQIMQQAAKTIKEAGNRVADHQNRALEAKPEPLLETDID